MIKWISAEFHWARNDSFSGDSIKDFLVLENNESGDVSDDGAELKVLEVLDLDVREPHGLDKVGAAHDGAVEFPFWRGLVNQKPTFSPCQVKIQLEGHGQRNVVYFAHL